MLKNKKIIYIFLVLAFFTRLIHLNAPFWLDESAQVLESSRSLFDQFKIDQDFQPPLLHLYLHFLLYFNQSEFYLRVLSSVLFSLVGLFYFYKLIQNKFDKNIVNFTLLFLSISSFLVYFSQELRQYALSFGLAMVTWYLIDNKKIKLIWWTIFSALGLLSSYLYVVVFLSQLVFLIFKRKISLLQLIKQGIFLFFLTSWWLYFFLRQFSVGQALRSEMVGWDQVVSFSFIKGLLLTFGKFFFGIINLEVNLFFIIFSLAILLIFIFGSFKIFSQDDNRNFNLLENFFYWLYLPLFVSLIINFFIPVLQPKRIIFLMPFLILNFFWFAFIIIKNKNFVAIFLTKLLIFLLFLINFYSLYLYCFNVNYQRENWLEMMQQVRNEFGVETALVSVFKGHFSPLVWYNKETALPLISVQSFSVESKDLDDDLISQINTYKTIVLVDYLADLTDPKRKTKQFLIENNFKEKKILSYPLIGQFFVFEKNKEGKK